MRSPSRTGAGVVRTIIQRFRTENMAQTASSLAFTTLLALVPLITLVVSVADSIPFFDSLIKRLDTLLVETLLPTGAGKTIAGHVAQFSHKARSLTVPGIAMLGVTAFLLMHTIERAFNHLWHVKPRPLLARLKLYAFVMAVWPFMLGALAGLMSYAVTVSLGFVQESSWIRPVILKAVSMVLLGLFFAFLYYAVPNVRVGRVAALVGGGFASLVFAAMQKGFELYLGSFGTFKSVYGAFAAFPIFLVWLHLSWAVVLIGGLVAATAFRPARR
ncbi:MAG TPA: YihY family inner membrane protein [Rhodocyclaceae bacterium]|nr:YihY family inner membrane protein [Rhodocyclaceae bacterium]